LSLKIYHHIPDLPAYHPDELRLGPAHLVLKAPQNPFLGYGKVFFTNLAPMPASEYLVFVVGLQEKPSVVPEHPWPYDQHLSENFTGNRVHHQISSSS
jgi:hypothetical protein